MGYAGDHLPKDEAAFEALVSAITEAHYNVILCRYEAWRVALPSKPLQAEDEVGTDGDRLPHVPKSSLPTVPGRRHLWHRGLVQIRHKSFI